MRKDHLLILMRSKKTVFTFKDLALLWGEINADFVKKKIYSFVDRKDCFCDDKSILY